MCLSEKTERFCCCNKMKIERAGEGGGLVERERAREEGREREILD